MPETRQLTSLDQIIIKADQALTTVFGNPAGTGRNHPADEVGDTLLDDEERRLAASLMRVNHVGEVCAQALYQAQSLTARNPEIKQRMQQASEEENDHLRWCAGRLEELGDRKSLLNPLWYGGAFAIGAVAGLAGDRWNLGFVAETERQVVDHLHGHLERLPTRDSRSRAIVEQMAKDEGEHASMAVTAGASTLPGPVKGLMKLASKVMTTTAERI